jgi:hypothetical protein
MGNGASSLPLKLTEDDAKAFCREKFIQKEFDRLKDGDGTVDRDQFLAAISKPVITYWYASYLKIYICF